MKGKLFSVWALYFVALLLGVTIARFTPIPTLGLYTIVLGCAAGTAALIGLLARNG